MRIISIIILVMFLCACTAVRITSNEKEGKIEANNTIKTVQSNVTAPKLNYDTPEIVKSKIMKETETESFGDII